ncbi:SDR family oxidoreductase [Fibrivirga algicola]|uniref:SDR family oxidoreductase n=1 Tax=Fibrivirga algicola TaxID=2950420 RepID=A0ABX0QMV3_9BACT|nr:SDR family oxidoreductase [Fibrivirga algicola]ARK12641.1 short-chain dehydrogenase/reductase [Fibrella sp. ES10-3-2-2]NID12197.1 SDR family oxidoreductase [Fibrivirga algicola]
MSKVILVTGASTGLGESIAAYLSQRGHTVYGTSRQADTSGKPFTMLAMDVTSAESIQQGVDHIVQREGRLDVIINNAGLGIAAPVEELPLADVLRVFDTNVLGIIRTVQAVLPVMRRQRSGLIINISSIAAEAGLPYRGGYSASKAAVERLTEALRLELAPFGVQACSIQPGGTRTDINKNRLRVSLAADSVYRKTFERTYELIDESVSGGIDPAVFGPLIDSIIQSPSVKRLYRVGKPLEKLSVLLKLILPTATYERMIRKHYEM